jgi:uncharacterized phage protein gp47/JayE
MVRDDITAAISGAVMLGNSVLRVVADANAGLAHLTLRYVDWLARQFLPDTAEAEWLDRHGDIWLTDADNTTGRKGPTFAKGSVMLTGTQGFVVPIGTTGFSNGTVEYETTEQVVLGGGPTEVAVSALTPGTAGNMVDGDALSGPSQFALTSVTVVSLDGGTDLEGDDDLRARVLLRIREPPMGGDKSDYEQWALAVPGVTRAWCAPLEMGMGTITIRFMMDDLRALEDGFPHDADVDNVRDYIDSVRPVAVKDRFVIAPERYELEVRITGLVDDSEAVRQRIAENITAMLQQRAKPGQTIYASWVSEAISQATGEDHHDLIFEDAVMPTKGALAVLGTLIFET